MEISTLVKELSRFHSITIINEEGNARLGLGVVGPRGTFKYEWSNAQDLETLLKGFAGSPRTTPLTKG